jgi:acyl-coenzyme A thioesterase 13
MLRRLSSTTTGSFIAKAKAANDARVLLGAFSSAGRFDVCLERAGMHCVAIGDGDVVCDLTVTEELANNYNTLHGGATSTIVDVVGTMALLSKDPTRAGVSIEMNQTFCAAAKVGDRLALFGTVLRYGRSLGFTEVRMRHLPATVAREEAAALLAAQGPDAHAILETMCGPVVAVGRHTKMFPS